MEDLLDQAQLSSPAFLFPRYFSSFLSFWYTPLQRRGAAFMQKRLLWCLHHCAWGSCAAWIWENCFSCFYICPCVFCFLINVTFITSTVCSFLEFRNSLWLTFAFSESLSVVPQITAVGVQTEAPGRWATCQADLSSAPHRDPPRTPTLPSTKATLLLTSRRRRSPPFPEVGKPPSLALQEVAPDQRRRTNPAGRRVWARIISTGRGRRASARTRGRRAFTPTARLTRARWRGGPGATRTTATTVRGRGFFLLHQQFLFGLIYIFLPLFQVSAASPPTAHRGAETRASAPTTLRTTTPATAEATAAWTTSTDRRPPPSCSIGESKERRWPCSVAFPCRFLHVCVLHTRLQTRVLS